MKLVSHCKANYHHHKTTRVCWLRSANRSCAWIFIISKSPANIQRSPIILRMIILYCGEGAWSFFLIFSCLIFKKKMFVRNRHWQKFVCQWKKVFLLLIDNLMKNNVCEIPWKKCLTMYKNQANPPPPFEYLLNQITLDQTGHLCLCWMHVWWLKLLMRCW